MAEPRNGKREKVVVGEDLAARVEALAEKMGKSPTAVRTLALTRGVEAMEAAASGGAADGGPADVSALSAELAKLRGQMGDVRRLSAEASKDAAASLALFAWVLPFFAYAAGDGNGFLAEVVRTAPKDMFRASRSAGEAIALGGMTFPAAISRLPEDAGFDVKAAFGKPLAEFKAECAAADEKERARNGKKRPR